MILICFIAVAYYYILPAGLQIEGRFRIPAMPFLASLVQLFQSGARRGLLEKAIAKRKERQGTVKRRDLRRVGWRHSEHSPT